MSCCCPHCDMEVMETPELAGQEVTCPGCEETFMMPFVSTESTPVIITTAPTRTTTRSIPRKQFWNMSKTGIVVLVLMSLVVLGTLVGGNNSVEERRFAGNQCHVVQEVHYNYGVKLTTWNMMKELYDLAHEHPNLQKIVFTFRLNTSLLSDEYGKRIDEPVFMGEIVVESSTLAEVRKYKDRDSFTYSDWKYAFASEVSKLKYARHFDDILEYR